MEKKTYYISVGTREISTSKTASPYELVIKATEQEIKQLREIFDEMHSADLMGFIRAHIPYVPYHYDTPNDLMDQGLVKAYQLMYELGTDETKQHIESMGVTQANDDHSIS